MQIMDGTHTDIEHRSGITGNVRDPEFALNAGAWYLGNQVGFFDRRAQRASEALWHGMGSYNAGAGNILKAVKLCNSDTWSHTITCLPKITGRHSKETITYVDRISNTWFPILIQLN